MKLASKNKHGEIYYNTDKSFKISKAVKRVAKELDKAGFKYEYEKSKRSNTVYMIVADVMVVRISSHTERSHDSDRYNVFNYREIKEGVIILERINILSNEDMFEFIDYLRKHKQN